MNRAPSWPLGASQLIAGADLAGVRLDTALVPLLGSKRAVAEALFSGRLFCNGASPTGSPRLRAGDVISLFPPEDDPQVRPEAIPLKILYEDEYLLVVHKPAGIPMYPGPGWPCRTLANGVRALLPKISAVKGEIRAGIVGRLDREVSGVILVAREEEVHQRLVASYVRREVRRRYLALVAGRAEDGESRLSLAVRREGRSGFRAVPEDTPGAVRAYSRWRVLRELGPMTLLEITPYTGRRHQLRVHLAAAGFPILGDRQYGGEVGRLRDWGGPARIYPSLRRIALHLEEVELSHPKTGERLCLRSPWPEDLPPVW